MWSEDKAATCHIYIIQLGPKRSTCNHCKGADLAGEECGDIIDVQRQPLLNFLIWLCRHILVRPLLNLSLVPLLIVFITLFFPCLLFVFVPLSICFLTLIIFLRVILPIAMVLLCFLIIFLPLTLNSAQTDFILLNTLNSPLTRTVAYPSKEYCATTRNMLCFIKSKVFNTLR